MSRKAIENLERKLSDEKFRTDTISMVSTERSDYNIEEAASQVVICTLRIYKQT